MRSSTSWMVPEDGHCSHAPDDAAGEEGVSSLILTLWMIWQWIFATVSLSSDQVMGWVTTAASTTLLRAAGGDGRRK